MAGHVRPLAHASSDRRPGLVKPFRLGDPDFGLRRDVFEDRRTPGRKAATAATDDEGVERSALCIGVFECLQRKRPLPLDDLRMIERGRQHHAALGDEPFSNRLAIFGITVIGDHVGAQRPDIAHFHRRRILGHNNRRFRAHHARRIGYALRMIAGRPAENAARPLGVG